MADKEAGLDIFLKDQPPEIKAWIESYLVPGLPILGEKLGIQMRAKLSPYLDSEAVSIEVCLDGR